MIDIDKVMKNIEIEAKQKGLITTLTYSERLFLINVRKILEMENDRITKKI